MSYRAIIDPGSCSGHGDCVAIAPHVFALDDVAIVHGTGTDAEILTAAEACPALAITVVDTQTGDAVFP
jgi:ferredoxin